VVYQMNFGMISKSAISLSYSSLGDKFYDMIQYQYYFNLFFLFCLKNLFVDK